MFLDWSFIFGNRTPLRRGLTVIYLFYNIFNVLYYRKYVNFLQSCWVLWKPTANMYSEVKNIYLFIRHCCTELRTAYLDWAGGLKVKQSIKKRPFHVELYMDLWLFTTSDPLSDIFWVWIKCVVLKGRLVCICDCTNSCFLSFSEIELNCSNQWDNYTWRNRKLDLIMTKLQHIFLI
jgi:hypothetical protein